MLCVFLLKDANQNEFLSKNIIRTQVALAIFFLAYFYLHIAQF